MPRQRPCRPAAHHARRLAARLAAPALCALALAAPAGAGAASLSSNWAGYVAARPAAGAASGAGSAAGFTAVSGAWVAPSARCAGASRGYSAVWVGLGGYHRAAGALEQIGTDADCAASGRPRYSSWYELLPAAPVALRLRIRPGDRISASVTARRRSVTLRLRNLTTKRRFEVKRRVSRLDTSTAEWIVEAPSECAGTLHCRTLPLADFELVSFTRATATRAGHTGAIGDPLWSAGALELRQSPLAAGAPAGAGSSASAALVGATPDGAALGSGAFSVRWETLPGDGEEPAAPTLPARGEPSA